MGCLSIIVIMGVALGLFVAGVWYLYAKSIDSLTDTAPTAVLMETPTEEQFAAASTKLEQLRTGASTKQAVTVEFTAAELNALIARHESFRDFRGKARIAIADSVATLDLSVPLRDLPLPRVRHRWFNGSLRVGFSYDQDQFSLDVQSLKANGRDIDLSFLQNIADNLNREFNKGFDKAQRESEHSNEFWENVDAMKLLYDKLIITTKGPQPATASP
jgi:hypothetical protein